MRDVVIIVLCAIAVLILVEIVLPRIWAKVQRFWHTRKWEREWAKEVSQTPSVAAPSTTSPSTSPTVSSSPSDSQLSTSNSQPAPAVPASGTAADELWAEARTKPHGFLPTMERDGEYLQLVYRAAQLGHLEAMTKLGEYASRRGLLVEAYYWTALADLNGAKTASVALRKIRAAWMKAGCPPEYENVYDNFSVQQGSFARALLRIRCAINAPLARTRMRELADQGLPEAKRFLSH